MSFFCIGGLKGYEVLTARYSGLLSAQTQRCGILHLWEPCLIEVHGGGRHFGGVARDRDRVSRQRRHCQQVTMRWELSSWLIPVLVGI